MDQDDGILALVEKYTVLTMTTVFTTFVFWMTFTLLVWSNYFDACTWLLSLDVWSNLMCTYLMFSFNQEYYNKCIKCKPFGTICLSLVKWIEMYKLKQEEKRMSGVVALNTKQMNQEKTEIANNVNNYAD